MNTNINNRNAFSDASIAAKEEWIAFKKNGNNGNSNGNSNGSNGNSNSYGNSNGNGNDNDNNNLQPKVSMFNFSRG